MKHSNMQQQYEQHLRDIFFYMYTISSMDNGRQMLCISIQSPTAGEKKSDVDRRIYSCCNTQQQGGGIPFNPFFLSPPLPSSSDGCV